MIVRAFVSRRFVYRKSRSDIQVWHVIRMEFSINLWWVEQRIFYCYCFVLVGEKRAYSFEYQKNDGKRIRLNLNIIFLPRLLVFLVCVYVCLRHDYFHFCRLFGGDRIVCPDRTFGIFRPTPERILNT